MTPKSRPESHPEIVVERDDAYRGPFPPFMSWTSRLHRSRNADLAKEATQAPRSCWHPTFGVKDHRKTDVDQMVDRERPWASPASRPTLENRDAAGLSTASGDAFRSFPQVPAGRSGTRDREVKHAVSVPVEDDVYRNLFPSEEDANLGPFSDRWGRRVVLALLILTLMLVVFAALTS